MQTEDTIVVIEYPVELGTLPPVLSADNGIESSFTDTGRRLVGVRNRRYGRTVIAIYVCAPSGKWNLDVRSEEFVDISK